MLRKRDYYKENARYKMEGKYQVVILFLLITVFITCALFYSSNALEIETIDGLVLITIKAGLPIVTLTNIITLITLSAFESSKMSILVDIVDDLEKEKLNLLEQFKIGFKYDLIRSIVIVFVRNLLIFLWSILLIVPGIIKSYSYSMAMYLTYRKPSVSGIKAINKSKMLTKGYKKEIFLLDLSYLGWYLVGLLTLGILWFQIAPKHLIARVLLFEDILKENEYETNI